MNKKRICILSTVNLKHMTLISKYTTFFEENNIKYDIIYIDKYQEEEEINAQNTYPYQININRQWPIWKKLLKYIKFRFYAKRIINRNKYNFIIVWNSFTAFMFFDLLIFKFKDKYCLNIRDYACEKHKLIYILMSKLVSNSKFSTISSEGFLNFLPNSNYIMMHSLNDKILSKCVSRTHLVNGCNPIRITFIGYVRFFENDKRLIDALGNDSRFILNFFGEGSHVLKEYAKKNGYQNIICKGRFEPHETIEFLNQTDIINNLYGVGEIALDTAISIKLYYALVLRVPILVFSNTYMADITQKYNFGIVVNGYENLADYIYDSYRNINFDSMNNGCENFIEDIREIDKIFNDTLIREFL